MKKLVLLLMLLALGAAALAETAEPVACEWTYALLADGTAEITGYTGTETVLAVPAALDGIPVSAIGKSAFHGCADLTKVSIPAGVKTLGDRAFSQCPALDTILLPPTLATIGKVVISDCPALLDLSIPSSVTSIDPDAFIHCRDVNLIVTKDTFPERYAISAQMHCIPVDVQMYSIGDWEFFLLPDGTAELSSYSGTASELTIPEDLGGVKVSRIGDAALWSCEKLTRVTIPDGVTAIGANPFHLCPKLKSFRVSPDHPTMAAINGVLYEKTEKRLVSFPRGASAEGFVIPQGIRSVDDYVFCNCDSLTALILPDSMSAIGDCAFSGCINLTTLYIPDSVKTIGPEAFSYCTSLTEAVLYTTGAKTTAGEYRFGPNIFSNCTALETLQLEFWAESTGNGAFRNCSSLTSVELPEGVKVISNVAFSDCTTLRSITLPSSLQSIDSAAFQNCRELQELIIPEGVTTIGDMYASDPFANCTGLTRVELPDSLTFIAENTFTVLTNPDMMLIVPRESYARQYALEHNLLFSYPDSLDWLLD